jgi:hypothetical protein
LNRLDTEALDLRQQRDRQVRAPRHLLEREAPRLAQVADLAADRGVQLVLAAQHEALLLRDPRDHLAELGRRERLVDVGRDVVLDRGGRAVERGVAGQDDHRDVVVHRADLGQEIHARDLGHHQVEHDQVEHLVPDPLHGQARVRKRGDLEALALEKILEVLEDVGIVVDDEHRQLRRRPQGCTPDHDRNLARKSEAAEALMGLRGSRGDRI